MSSKLFHAVAIIGIVLVAVSFVALPWLSFGETISWTGIGLFEIEAGMTVIGVIAFTLAAAALTIAAIVKPNKIVKIAAIVLGAAILLPLLSFYSDMTSSSIGDGSSLISIGFWLTAAGALIVAVFNSLGLATQRT